MKKSQTEAQTLITDFKARLDKQDLKNATLLLQKGAQTFLQAQISKPIGDQKPLSDFFSNFDQLPVAKAFRSQLRQHLEEQGLLNSDKEDDILTAHMLCMQMLSQNSFRDRSIYTQTPPSQLTMSNERRSLVWLATLNSIDLQTAEMKKLTQARLKHIVRPLDATHIKSVLRRVASSVGFDMSILDPAQRIISYGLALLSLQGKLDQYKPPEGQFQHTETRYDDTFARSIKSDDTTLTFVQKSKDFPEPDNKFSAKPLQIVPQAITTQMYFFALVLGHIFSRFIHLDRESKTHNAAVCFYQLFSRYASLPPQHYPARVEDYSVYVKMQISLFIQVLKLVDNKKAFQFHEYLSSRQRVLLNVPENIRQVLSPAELRFTEFVKQFVSSLGMDFVHPSVSLFIIDSFLQQRAESAKTQLSFLYAIACLMLITKRSFEELTAEEMRTVSVGQFKDQWRANQSLFDKFEGGKTLPTPISTKFGTLANQTSDKVNGEQWGLNVLATLKMR